MISAASRGWRFAAGIAATGLTGFLASALFTRAPADQRSASLGVAAATSSGLLSLLLKRWALRHSLKAALAVVGVMFGVRLIVVALGIALLTFSQVNSLPFVVGFFAVYFVLQWLEIGYVSGAANRNPHP